MKQLYIRPIRAIVLHHTGSPSLPEEQMWKNLIAYSKRQYAHLWTPYTCDYHWLIGQSGAIYPGQPEKYFAIHSGIDEWDSYQDSSRVNNQNSIAISVIGNYQSVPMLSSMIDGVVRCIQQVRGRYPKAFIKLHRELVATDCPGYRYDYAEVFRRLNMKFKDVDPKRWSYPAIDWVSNEQLMKGDEKGFRPQEKLSREEMAQILFNLHQKGKL